MNNLLHNSSSYNRKSTLLCKKLPVALTLLLLSITLNAMPNCAVAQAPAIASQPSAQDQDRNSFIEKYATPLDKPAEPAAPTNKQATDQQPPDAILPELQAGQSAPAATVPASAPASAPALAPKAPYKSLHDKSIWEKLKIPPRSSATPHAAAEQDQETSSPQLQPPSSNATQPEQRHNIYK